MANLVLQLHDYRLTTAEIFYHMPDYPKLLQAYVWQEYDIAPAFPKLHHFLEFWTREIDGKLHSVFVANRKIITAGEIGMRDNEFLLN